MIDRPLPLGAVLHVVDPGWTQALESFFGELAQHGDYRWFHPFPLDGESARAITESTGVDRYLIATHEGEVLALGMLRGWDEGYEIPSLGIAVAPKARGKGLARAIMAALHDEARHHGSKRVRLTVDQANDPAIELYLSLGYVFEQVDDDRLQGVLEV